MFRNISKILCLNNQINNITPSREQLFALLITLFFLDDVHITCSLTLQELRVDTLQSNKVI